MAGMPAARARRLSAASARRHRTACADERIGAFERQVVDDVDERCTGEHSGTLPRRSLFFAGAPVTSSSPAANT